VLGVRTNVIGLIEGIAEATASLLKVFSAPFYFGAILALIAAVAMALWKPEIRRNVQ